MKPFDFVIQVGPTAPEAEPVNVFRTPEANEALHHAYQWAKAKAETNVFANAAKVYIEAIEMNRDYDPSHPDRADHTQLLYIINNLRNWRGEHAKESREALKAYSVQLAGWWRL